MTLKTKFIFFSKFFSTGKLILLFHIESGFEWGAVTADVFGCGS